MVFDSDMLETIDNKHFWVECQRNEIIWMDMTMKKEGQVFGHWVKKITQNSNKVMK